MSAGLSACGTLGGGSGDSRIASAGDIPGPGTAQNGPRADYPVVVGEPYRIGDVEYVPSNSLNYDHVGYVTEAQGAMGYSGAHHVLPIPSYVEVTALDTGRTVLVRLDQRGPMDSNHLIALSPAAMTQLGAGAETPVRVRRVNPPETDRFALRAGQPASLRMDTPTSLLTVLQRRLPANGAASLRAENAATPAVPAAAAATDNAIQPVVLAVSEAAGEPVAAVTELPPVVEAAPAPVQVAAPQLPPVPAPEPVSPPVVAEASPPALPPLDAVDTVTVTRGAVPEEVRFAEAFEVSDTPEPIEEPVVVAVAEPAAEQTPAPAAEAEGNFVVQAAAFSTMERAERVANVIGGVITRSGRYYRVRTGPFVTRGEAEASLANVRRAGYSDARILTNG